MSTRFEYAPCSQRAKYNNITLSVTWKLSNQLKYISIIAPGNFNVIMDRTAMHCSLSDGRYLWCDSYPLIDSFATYLASVIHDNDHKSMDNLLQRIESSAMMCWDGDDLMKTIVAIIQDMLIVQAEQEIAAEIAAELGSAPERESTITITINKTTALVVALVVMIVALAAVNPF